MSASKDVYLFFCFTTVNCGGYSTYSVSLRSFLSYPYDYKKVKILESLRTKRNTSTFRIIRPNIK